MKEDHLAGKVAVVTGAGSGIGRASLAMLVAAGARVVAADRDPDALYALAAAHGDAVLPLPLDLLDPAQCAALVPEALRRAGRAGRPGHIDILHANAGAYLGGDLVEADPAAIDRVVALNVAVVMKNVRDVLPGMIAQGAGDVVVTSSLAAHFPTPWEPVYASSKWAVDCFVQTTRRQVFRHGIRVGAVSPGPVASALLKDWPAERLAAARAQGTLLEPEEVAAAIGFMLSRPRGTTVRDIVLLPTNFDL